MIAFCEKACRTCGWRHQLDAFKPRHLVEVVSQEPAWRDYRKVNRVGETGMVVEWSAYCSAVYVRVQFADGERENFDPCELEHIGPWRMS